MPNSKKELLDIIQLINSENVGPVTFYKLVETFGSPALALSEAPKIKKIRLCSRTWAEDELARVQDADITLITYTDQRYPQHLKLIEDCPPLLYVRGNPEVLQNNSCVAIVGARNASINGRKTASRIAYDLSNKGVCIVSGMARGIDTAAHKGAMYANMQQGETIAVLGCGVDVVYPKENITVYNQIANQGCIISELPLGTSPQFSFFPRRNRIVAAMCLGTLVVEATLKSGSLITAELAQNMGRQIFAVPGSPIDARAEGPNKLIKDGAFLVESAADILSHLPAQTSYLPRKKSYIRQKALVFATNDDNLAAEKTSADLKIIDYLNHDGVYVDEIIRQSGLTPAEVALQLLELEMSGRIERQSGNKVALIK